MNAGRLLVETAQRFPEHPAIIFKGQVITYQELVEKIYRVANGLSQLGLGEYDRIGLFLRNYPEYIISYFAAITIGATVVPLNFIFQAREVAFVMNDSESVAIFADSQFLGTVLEAKKDLKTIKHIIVVGNTPEKGVVKFTDLLTQGSPSFSMVPRMPDDVAQIIYTSGTTGTPKGAMIPHSNLTWMARTLHQFYQITHHDRVLCVLPLFHAYAKLQCMWSPISCGATIVLMDKFEPVPVMKEIVDELVTVFFGVPTMFVMLVNHPDITNYDFSNLRCCVSGGASIAVEVIHRVKEKMGVEICEGYGLTECTVLACCNPYDGLKKPGSIGPGIPGIVVKVVDENDHEVPVGEVGELVIKGPNVMKGYYNKPEATAQALRNGWLHTGDIARQDEDGYFYIVDRKKDMYIRGGYNVYPREVEEVLFTFPKIAEVAVVGVPDEVYGEEGMAWIVLRPGETVTQEEIIEFCRSRLAKYKVPKYIQFVEALPKTATGKISKIELRALFHEKMS